MVDLPKSPVALDRHELTPTRKAYFRIFDTFYCQGMSQSKAFNATENYFEDLGYTSPYRAFETFREAYRQQCLKDLGLK